MSIDNKDKAIFIGLFLIAFLVILNSTFSPINFRRMHVDSAAYVTIAQGITRGLLPYRDFVDNKGPLLYLISAVGLRFGGFIGIWVMELIFMFVSVFFAYKLALFFGDRLKAVLGTVFSFIGLLAFFIVNAGTEAYSLPFLLISLYIFTKHFFSNEQKVSFVELIVLGASFTCAIMIRLNMFPLWVGFCLVIAIDTIIKRRFVQLGKYVLGFCLGVAIIGLPIFLYLSLNGIMADFFEQVVFGGASRGFGGSTLRDTAKNFFVVINRDFTFVPLAIGLFWLLKRYRKNPFSYSMAYVLSCFLMILFLAIPNIGGHGNLVIIPFFVPAFTFLIGIVHSALSDKKNKTVLTIVFF